MLVESATVLILTATLMLALAAPVRRTTAAPTRNYFVEIDKAISQSFT